MESCQLASDSQRLQRIEAIRAAAMCAFHQFEYDSALRNSLLRKPRPFRGPFYEGQRVAYFRQKNSLDGEGSVEGYRQGTVVAVDQGQLWIRNSRGRLVSCSREQVRDVAGEEEWWVPSQSDLDLLKKSDQDLSEKHSLAFRADDRPGPSQEQAALDTLDAQLQDLSEKHSLAFRADDRPGPSQEQAALDTLDAQLQPALDVPVQPQLPALPALLDAAGNPLPAEQQQVPLVAPSCWFHRHRDLLRALRDRGEEVEVKLRHGRGLQPFPNNMYYNLRNRAVSFQNSLHHRFQNSLHHFQNSVHHFQNSVHHFQNSVHHFQNSVHHFQNSWGPSQISRLDLQWVTHLVLLDRCLCRVKSLVVCRRCQELPQVYRETWSV